MSQDSLGNAVVTNNPQISVADDTSEISESPCLEPFLPLLSFPNTSCPPESEQMKQQKDKCEEIVLLDYPLCGTHMKNLVFCEVRSHLIL